MLSKTRTAIISLVAAFSFAGAAIVPTAAQARKKKPGIQKACENLARQFDFWEQQYNADALAHEPNAVLEADIKEANAYFEEARLLGCSWTGREQPPSGGPATGLRPEGEPKSLGEPGSPPPTRPTPPPPAGTLG
jgi:hypothetical protein